MKNNIVLFSIVAYIILLATSCGGSDYYQKTTDGILYRIYHTKTSDHKIDSNKFIKVLNAVYVGDSIAKPFNQDASYEKVGSIALLTNIYTQMYEGDSVVVKQSLDSMVKQGFPIGNKKGQFLTVHIYVTKLFDSLSQAENDRQIEMDAKKSTEIEAIKAYLKEKNITKAIENKEGYFVEVLKEGAGPIVGDAPMQVGVRYKGILMSNDTVVFDQNIDDKKPLFEFPTASHRVIPGFDLPIQQMKKGEKIRVFIPATLGYGARGAGAVIPPNSNLIFEIELQTISAIKAMPAMPGAPTANIKKGSTKK